MTDEITIQLTNGAEKIEDCMEKVNRYCRPINEDGVAAFELYDQIPVSEDDKLTVCDIWLANGIGARIETKHLVELWKRNGNKEEIEKLLASIPKRTGLESDDWDPKCFEHLEQLLAAWMSLSGWKAARVTKTLHKKRPKLIPPIDSQVMGFYSETGGAEGKETLELDTGKASDVIEVLRRVRCDLRYADNLAKLRTIQTALEDRNIRLSIVRIFDIILYQHILEKRERQNPVYG